MTKIVRVAVRKREYDNLTHPSSYQLPYFVQSLIIYLTAEKNPPGVLFVYTFCTIIVLHILF